MVGGGDNYGRVEIKVGDVWGTVCDENWDDREAGVFCRQKGFDDGYALGEAKYGRGTGPVWLSHMMCTGTEANLHKCPHKGFNDEVVDDSGYYKSVCESHADDASVYCVKSCRLIERKREMFYLTTHSKHFIYGYKASDIWLRTILIVRKETRCCHIGYSYRLTTRVLLYAPSHRQDALYISNKCVPFTVCRAELYINQHAWVWYIG